jgi:hypothetical protein
MELMMHLNQLAACSFAVLGLLAVAGAAQARDGNLGTPIPGGAAPETASGDRWAVIGSGCVFSRGKGFVSAVSDGTGACIVKFNKNVTRCLYVATIGLPGISGTEIPGQIAVVRRVTDPNAVYVTTQDSAGTLANRGFHLLVGCG